jgi:glutamate-1-semialdehyde 2,1-aminomutase
MQSERVSKLLRLRRQARDDFELRHPKSKLHYEDALTVLPGGTTRSVLRHTPFPLVVAAGCGSTVTDVDGRQYIDFLGDFSCGLLGHSNEKLLAHLLSTLSATGLNVGGVHPNEKRLAKLMCRRFGLDRVRFTNSGTEANLMALTCALMWQAKQGAGRTKVLVFDGSYHGSVLHFKGGNASWNAPYSFVLAKYNDVDDTLRVIRAHADTLAAVMVEPMLGSTGCVPATPAFMRALVAEASAAGALLIADEVQTSRHGRHGMMHLFGERADLSTFGKYIGGGFSFGALGGRADVMQLFAEDLPHGGTFNNNIASMASGCAVLAELYTSEVAERHTARGDAFRQRLAAVLGRHTPSMGISGYGTAMCLHATRPASPNITVDAIRQRDEVLQEVVVKGLLARGVLVGARGLISLNISHSEEDLDALVAAVDETLRDLARALS